MNLNNVSTVTTRRLTVLLALCFWVCHWVAYSAPLTNSAPHKTSSPKPAPPYPAPASDRFRIKPGFRLELAASDPLVFNPLAMAFDENGRLFVIESRDSLEGTPGRIRLLEDSEGTGSFDISTLYAENLSHPSAIVCYGGGVFVAAGSEILYLKDTKGDGAADVRRVVFTSFGNSDNKVAGVISFTSLAWGLDNRIHVGTAGKGGDAISGSEPRSSVVLSAGNFSFDPRSFQLFDEGGSAQSGMCFDGEGRCFVCATNRPIELVMGNARYAWRDPNIPVGGSLLDLTAGNPARLIFPLRAGAASRAYGFGSASGLTIYRGSAFPAGYSGDAFVADSAAGVVHRMKLRENGLQMSAERPVDEAGTEFLACADPSFQPVQVVNGPDGTLYIADRAVTYIVATGVTGRSTIPSVPGMDRGRIYHLVPAVFNSMSPPQLSRMQTRGLVNLLRSPNGWHCDTAARLLYERQDKSAVQPLNDLLNDAGAPPLARVRALYALAGERALFEAQVIRALNDPDARVREHAVRLAEGFLNGGGQASQMLWPQISRMAGDPSIRVRLQVALSLGAIHNEGRVQALTEILERDPADRWVQSAVLNSVGSGVPEMFAALAGDARFRNSETGRECLRQLLLMGGAKNQAGDTESLLRTLAGVPEASLAFELANALDEGLQMGRSSLAAADTEGILRPLYALALDVVFHSDPNTSLSVEAVRCLGASSYETVGGRLFDLLSLPQDEALQKSVINTLGRFNDPQIGFLLEQRYGLFRANARAEAIVVMLARPQNFGGLVEGLEKNIISRDDLSTAQVRCMLAQPSAPTHREWLRTQFPDGNSAAGRHSLAQLQSSLQLQGNALRGRNQFLARCAACHEVAGLGNPAGVDLKNASLLPRAQLLAAILAPPTAPSVPEHVESLVLTSAGETLSGFVIAQNANSLTLGQASGSRRIIPRYLIQRTENLAVSAMPDNLGAGSDPQTMADLLEFLLRAGLGR